MLFTRHLLIQPHLLYSLPQLSIQVAPALIWHHLSLQEIPRLPELALCSKFAALLLKVDWPIGVAAAIKEYKPLIFPIDVVDSPGPLLLFCAARWARLSCKSTVFHCPTYAWRLQQQHMRRQLS